MHHLLIGLIFCFCLIDVCVASANTQDEVVVVVPALEQPYAQLISSMKKQLEQQEEKGQAQQKDLSLRIVTLPASGSSMPANDLFKPGQLVVSLGFRATEFTLASKQNIRVISSFVTRSAMENIQQKNNTAGNGLQLLGVLYLDQPVSRILSLLRLVYPEAKKIGAVYGPVSVRRQEEVNHQVASYPIAINDAVILEDDNPLKKLNAVFKGSDAVLVLPDKSSFNRRIAKWVIRLSIKNRVPVIGYSRKYAQAGALASVYSSIEQIAKQTAELIYQWQTTIENPDTQYLYPKYFSVSVNERVEKALGIQIDNRKTLVEQVNTMEGLQNNRIIEKQDN